MKRTGILVLASQLLISILVVPLVNAQTITGAAVGAGTSGYGYAAPAVIASPPPTVPMPPVPTIVEPPPGMPVVDSGFIQFNNLTVDSISGTNLPAEILAANPNIYPVMGMSTTGNAGVSTGVAVSAKCFKFNNQNTAASQPVSCPLPTNLSASGAVTATSSAGASAMYPYPIRYQPYRIEIDASTRLSLRDRTVATLGSFSAGDQINVFGYYNPDGSIQAYLVRDLSKPIQDQFLQLNNMQLVSISTGTMPATLVLTQSSGYPCYGYGGNAINNNATKQAIMCPMNAQGTMNTNSATFAPSGPNEQMMLKRYVVTVNAQTIILDSNRTALALSDLQVGDSLNIYGDSIDNGQTITAAIVRDLSIPATPSTYNGKVTQVNADGSFVIQTNDGQTIIVQNPIQVGATIQLSGLLNRLKNVLSQVTSIYMGGSTIYPQPLPMTTPRTPNTLN